MASSSSNPQMLPNGSMSELFHFPMAAVMLLDYDERKTVRLLGLGVFQIKLIVQRTAPPILMAYCSVNGFQWPLVKDAPIIRICKRSFIFGLPGLLYALQFPSICPDTHIDSLERLFMKFGHYENYGDPAFGRPGYPCADNEPGIWGIVRPLAEPNAHEVLVHFGYEPGRLITVLPHAISCYTRATRMSAATKAIANGHISGTLRRIHITVAGNDNGGSTHWSASPSITVFTCLVDAIESAWMYSMGAPAAVLDMMNPYLGFHYRHPGFRVWRLSQMGLTTFVRGLESAGEREEQIVTVKTEIGDDDGDKEKEGAEAPSSSSDAARANRRKETKP